MNEEKLNESGRAVSEEVPEDVDGIEIERVTPVNAEEYFIDGDDAETAAEEQLPDADANREARTFSESAVTIADDMVDSSRYFRARGNAGLEEAENVYSDGDPEVVRDDGNKKKKGKKSVGREILSWVLTFVIAFLVAILINAYVFRISTVSGNSMLQSYSDGQTVFISRLPYIFSEPKYGDVVVFDHDQVHRNFFVEIKESIQYNIITIKLTKKNLDHKYWIKRVIGVAGDTIEIKEDGVYRNGEKLQEDYVNPNETPRYTLGKWVVGEGEIFVMGDNRNHSSDSRVIGTIKINSILGKVIKS